jgi:hypothetical protein
MDIVGDASTAIHNFLQFGLDGPTKYDEVGERYLRLYGVLNASYIQQEAIHNLYKLANVTHPREIKRKIGSLKIREVRHKLGAHSNDYLNRTTEKVESFVPVRVSLSGFNCGYLNNETMKMETVNLQDCLYQHLELMVDLLDEIYEKTIKTVYKSDSRQKKEFIAKLDDLRIIRKGGSVIELPEGKKLIINVISQEQDKSGVKS